MRGLTLLELVCLVRHDGYVSEELFVYFVFQGRICSCDVRWFFRLVMKKKLSLRIPLGLAHILYHKQKAGGKAPK